MRTPRIRGAAAAALEAAGKGSWAILRDKLLAVQKLKGTQWYHGHAGLTPPSPGMGATGREKLIADLTASKDPLLTRAMLYAAGEAGWVDPAITAVARRVVSGWHKGGADKHTGTGPVTYLCAAVNEPGVAQLLLDRRSGAGDNGGARNLIHSTLAFHTPVAVRVAYAKSSPRRPVRPRPALRLARPCRC